MKQILSFERRILFLKMDSEKEELGLCSSIPEGYKWEDLEGLSGTGYTKKVMSENMGTQI